MLNNVCLIGRLVSNPELKTFGESVLCNFCIAVSRDYKNKETGEYEADFINCTAYRQQAELISKYFSKGSMIAVSGSIKVRKYQHNDETRTAFGIEVSGVTFIERKKTADNEPGHVPPPTAFAQSSATFTEVADSDDLPF